MKIIEEKIVRLLKDLWLEIRVFGIKKILACLYLVILYVGSIIVLVKIHVPGVKPVPLVEAAFIAIVVIETIVLLVFSLSYVWMILTDEI